MDLYANKGFNPTEIQRLKKAFVFTSSRDVAARIWALIAFQHWHKSIFSG